MKTDKGTLPIPFGSPIALRLGRIKRDASRNIVFTLRILRDRRAIFERYRGTGVLDQGEGTATPPVSERYAAWVDYRPAQSRFQMILKLQLHE
jgi:hypothetical protein